TNFSFTNLQIIKKWPGFNRNQAGPSFVIPFDPRSNHFAFMQSAQYSQKSHTFVPLTLEYERNQSPRFEVPHWWLTLKTRLRFVLVDADTQRIVDYVNLSSVGDPMYPIDMNQWLSRDATCSTTYNVPTIVPDGLLWCTNQAS